MLYSVPLLTHLCSVSICAFIWMNDGVTRYHTHKHDVVDKIEGEGHER